jgi:hypothetical protein
VTLQGVLLAGENISAQPALRRFSWNSFFRKRGDVQHVKKKGKEIGKDRGPNRDFLRPRFFFQMEKNQWDENQRARITTKKANENGNAGYV